MFDGALEPILIMLDLICCKICFFVRCKKYLEILPSIKKLSLKFCFFPFVPATCKKIICLNIIVSSKEEKIYDKLYLRIMYKMYDLSQQVSFTWKKHGIIILYLSSCTIPPAVLTGSMSRRVQVELKLHYVSHFPPMVV